jgi:CBS domain-containing protein
MLRNYAPLPCVPLLPGASFAQPVLQLPERVALDSPALEVMTDFSRVSAVLIRPTDSVDEAHARMKQRGVRLLLVVDSERKVVGLITATDILGEKPLQVIQARGVRHADLLTRDIMVPSARLEVIEFEHVRVANVGQIIATLMQSGRQHAAVVENAQGGHILRGLFSATQVARQLGRVIQPTEIARTFAEIEVSLSR